MGFSIQQAKEEVQAAHQFQLSAELRDVELLDCTASTSEETAQLHEQLRLGLKMEPAVLHVGGGEARFAVRIHIFGDAPDAPTGTDEHLFQIACRYSLTYALRPGYAPGEQEVEAFKEGNAIFH